MWVVVAITEIFFFFQAEDGIRDLVRSRGLGDVYKRQLLSYPIIAIPSMLMMMGLLFWLARGAKALTGLDLHDMLRTHCRLPGPPPLECAIL